MGGGNRYSTEKTMAPPRTMGHEIVGVVEALGPDARGAKVGDKAVVYPWIGCGKCWYCTNGMRASLPHAAGAGRQQGRRLRRPRARAGCEVPLSLRQPADRARLPLCLLGHHRLRRGQEGGRPGRRQADPGDRRGRRRPDGRALRQVGAGPRADRGRHRREQAQARPGERRLRRPRPARQGSAQAGAWNSPAAPAWARPSISSAPRPRPSSACARSAAAGG